MTYPEDASVSKSVPDLVAELENFFVSCCDGEWEHCEGMTIETLDNPGWAFKVDLEDTELFGLEFGSIEQHRSDDDWIICRVRNGTFEGFGGPRNLSEILATFLGWARKSSASDNG